jgi:hypothetical protein
MIHEIETLFCYLNVRVRSVFCSKRTKYNSLYEKIKISICLERNFTRKVLGFKKNTRNFRCRMNCSDNWYRLSENWKFRKSVKLLIFSSRTKQFGKISQRFPLDFPYFQHTIHCIIITHSIRGKPNTKFKIKYLFGLQTNDNQIIQIQWDAPEM